MSSNIIFYIHGALSSPTSWNYINNHLVLADKMSYFFSYDISTEPADKITERLVEWAQTHVHGIEPKKLLIVGHSFGGVLAVALSTALGDWFKKERNTKVEVIALAPPFAGSQVASILRFIKPGSIFFKNIGASDTYIREFKETVLFHKTHIIVTTAGAADWIGEENDGVVTFKSMKHFEEDPKAKLIYVPVNHFEILLDPSVPKLIKQRLSVRW